MHFCLEVWSNIRLKSLNCLCGCHSWIHWKRRPGPCQLNVELIHLEGPEHPLKSTELLTAVMFSRAARLCLLHCLSLQTVPQNMGCQPGLWPWHYLLLVIFALKWLVSARAAKLSTRRPHAGTKQLWVKFKSHRYGWW